MAFLLSDSIDSKNRMLTDTKIIGALKFNWEAKELPMLSKHKSCAIIPVNLLLQGSENWSGNKSDARILEVFHHKAM